MSLNITRISPNALIIYRLQDYTFQPKFPINVAANKNKQGYGTKHRIFIFRIVTTRNL